MCGLSFVHFFVAIAAVNAVKPPHQIVPGNQLGSSHDSAGQLPGADGSTEGVFTQMNAVLGCSLHGFLHVHNIQIHISCSSHFPISGTVPAGGVSDNRSVISGWLPEFGRCHSFWGRTSEDHLPES